MTETKAITPFELKSADSGARTFEGLSSTWDLDLGGDVIHKGAFKRTLHHWKQSGRVIPLIDQHNYGSVRSVLGKMLDAKETDDGLWTKWQVTEGTDGDEFMHRLRGGMVNGLSIGYEAVSPEKDSKGVRHLKELKLVEVSAVIWGMNPNALIHTNSVKSFLRTLSEEDRKELRALLRDGELEAQPEPEPENEPDIVPEPEPEAKAAPVELAPDDPQRIAMEERARAILLRSLGTAA